MAAVVVFGGWKISFWCYVMELALPFSCILFFKKISVLFMIIYKLPGTMMELGGHQLNIKLID